VSHFTLNCPIAVMNYYRILIVLWFVLCLHTRVCYLICVGPKGVKINIWESLFLHVLQKQHLLTHSLTAI